MSSGEGHGKKAIVAALAANMGIAVAKFVGFVFTGSGALLAEGVHSLADTGNQGLLLLGSARSKREATPTHPFGFGRERYFWAFVVAIVLFTMGSMFALYDGVEKVRHPHELDQLGWAIGILAVAIVLESFSLRTALAEAHASRPGHHTLWQYVKESKSPEIPVVLLEDTAALLGLVFALGAILTAHFTGEPRWDGVGTIAIGLLLGVVAIVLAREMKSLLIGEAASPSRQAAINEALVSDDAVLRVIHMRTEHLGPDELLLAAKIELRHDLTLPEIANAIDRVEVQVRAAVPTAKLIYLEPDISRNRAVTS